MINIKMYEVTLFPLVVGVCLACYQPQSKAMSLGHQATVNGDRRSAQRQQHRHSNRGGRGLCGKLFSKEIKQRKYANIER